MAAQSRLSLVLAGVTTVGVMSSVHAPLAAAEGPILHASTNDIGKRWTVCARDLTIRSAPGGAVIGTLTGPQTGGPAQSFTIADPSAHGGEWVRGHAWGHLNRDGYIQNGWFCGSNQPAPPPLAPSAPAAPPEASAARNGCDNFYAVATAKDRVSPIAITENGWRSYSIGVASYLRRCGYVHARNCLYIDTRNLPYGHKVWFIVSTRRSDGKWARSHKAPILNISGERKIQEKCLGQRRGVVVRGKQLSITKIRVWHTANTPGDGTLIPRSSTIKANYRPYYGQVAKPGQ